MDFPSRHLPLPASELGTDDRPRKLSRLRSDSRIQLTSRLS